MRLERRQALWLPIVLLHGLLLLASLPRPAVPVPAERLAVAVRLLPASPRPRASPAPPRATPGPARIAARVALPSATEAPRPAAVAAKPAEEPAAAAPDDAASGPLAEGPRVPLLQTEATRRALWQATREPLLSERATAATDAPARETAQQRFGREVARTAYGNCLKGEFPGAGAGLLSLPMFLIAEASGRCQK